MKPEHQYPVTRRWKQTELTSRNITGLDAESRPLDFSRSSVDLREEWVDRYQWTTSPRFDTLHLRRSCQNISLCEPEQSLSLSQDEGEQC